MDVDVEFQYWAEKSSFSYTHEGDEYYAELTWVNLMPYNKETTNQD
jgi:hypothetical protein